MAEAHAEITVPMTAHTVDTYVKTSVHIQDTGIKMKVSENDACAQANINTDDICIVPVSTQSDNVEIAAGVSVAIYNGRGSSDLYTGEYTVAPAFEQQKLQTKHKIMSDDVTVLAIEVSHVSNTSGGNTVFIGGVFDG